MPNRRRLLLSLGAVIVSLALLVVASEILLRATGREAWGGEYPKGQHEPIMNEFDAELGWRLVPGSFAFPLYDSTIWPERARATSASRPPENPRVVFVGGSYTYGWAVPDAETFAYRVQTLHPDVPVLNLGVIGYGTYQSLLRLERWLAPPGNTADLVVYGFQDDHERRNIATADWLKTIALGSRRGHRAIPFCLLDGSDELSCRPPDVYPTWPLRRQLALVAFLEDRWTAWRTRERVHQRAVTEKLLSRMDRLVRERDGRLLVAMLAAGEPNRSAYTAHLRSADIALVDCVDAEFGTRAMMVPFDGHPNARMHARWASCLANATREWLDSPSVSGP